MSHLRLLDLEQQVKLDTWVKKMLDALPSGGVGERLSFLYVRAIQLEDCFGFLGYLHDAGYEAWRYDRNNQLWYEIWIDPSCFLESGGELTCAHEMGHILHDYLQNYPKFQQTPERVSFHCYMELACEQFALQYLALPGIREEMREILDGLSGEPYRVEFPLRTNPPRPAP